MRNKRKLVLNMIEDGNLNNARLAEYFAGKFKEAGCGQPILQTERMES